MNFKTKSNEDVQKKLFAMGLAWVNSGQQIFCRSVVGFIEVRNGVMYAISPWDESYYEGLDLEEME